MIGLLLLGAANSMLSGFDPKVQAARNLKEINQHLKAESERREMRRFLLDRGLDASDETLARMGH